MYLCPLLAVNALSKQGGTFNLTVGEKYIWDDASTGYSNNAGNTQITLTGAIDLTNEWVIITDVVTNLTKKS